MHIANLNTRKDTNFSYSENIALLLYISDLTIFHSVNKVLVEMEINIIENTAEVDGTNYNIFYIFHHRILKNNFCNYVTLLFFYQYKW